jgi:DegV family protein with EDD domain
MGRVHIVTDSSARFTNPDILTTHAISLVPNAVRLGVHTARDHPRQGLEALRESPSKGENIPSAVPPSPTEIAALYAELQKETDQILSIHTSSSLSQALSHAEQASQKFLGRMDIHIIDSRSASIGLGMIVEGVAKAAARGESLDALVRITRSLIPRVYMVFFLNDLMYLEHNGLISRSQAILGNMLGIIPFVTIEDGRLIPMEKVRSRHRAIEKLIEFVCEFSDVEQLGILQSQVGPTHESRSIAERLQSTHPYTNITITSYGPTMAAFVGFDSLGVAVLESEEDLDW